MQKQPLWEELTEEEKSAIAEMIICECEGEPHSITSAEEYWELSMDPRYVDGYALIINRDCPNKHIPEVPVILRETEHMLLIDSGLDLGGIDENTR
jgi:hypothetical protein